MRDLPENKTQNIEVSDNTSLNGPGQIEVYGARVHNLKNINVKMPRNKLVVITGLSGSGKSSLAFDTIYAEGQRRYMETFSAYARQFIGGLERPDVDKIDGLSPVISIEQKTVNKNPRSTVGTITEVYDFLRLLYARIGDAYSYNTGEKMVRYSEQQIIKLIDKKYAERPITILAPVVKARKGHYRELFEQVRKQGFLKVRIDGEIRDINFGMRVDRYKTHDIEIVVDRVVVEDDAKERLVKSIQTALKYGKGILMVLDKETDELKHFSKLLMCPTTGIAYDEPEPNTFSFNSPYGACHHCNGLGQVSEIDFDKVIPDKKKSIKKGGLSPLGEYKSNWIFKQIGAIGEKYGFDLNTPIRDIPEEGMTTILYGSNEVIHIKNEYLGVSSTYSLNFEGIINFITNQNNENASASIKKWVGSFMNRVACPECKGKRLKKESLHFKVLDKNISDLATFDLIELRTWIDALNDKLDERKGRIANEILREISTRIGFLLEVGLDYVTLNRTARSLSGGESQRIRLATQIGSQLTGVLYILDEPSIGLHQRDNKRLIEALKELRDVGNSVIVVEHDKEMIMSADYIVDIGPGAGRKGGVIVGVGSPNSMMNCETITCQYLNGIKEIAVPDVRRPGNGNTLTLKGATGNNLRKVNLSQIIPGCSL